MAKRPTPTRSTAAAKSTRAPRKKPTPKPTPAVDADEDLDDEPPEPPRPGVRSRQSEVIRITTQTAGLIVGVGGRQLMNLKAEGCPVPDGGVKSLHEVAAIVRWRMDQIRELCSEGEEIDDLDREEKRTKLILLQTKISRELDHVLDADPYIHHLSVLWSEHNSLLDGMGRKLAPFLVDLTEEEDIKDKIDEFVAGLKKRFNPDEAMNPITTEHDPFTDEVVGAGDDEDEAGGDDEDD